MCLHNHHWWPRSRRRACNRWKKMVTQVGLDCSCCSVPALLCPAWPQPVLPPCHCQVQPWCLPHPLSSIMDGWMHVSRRQQVSGDKSGVSLGLTFTREVTAKRVMVLSATVCTLQRQCAVWVDGGPERGRMVALLQRMVGVWDQPGLETGPAWYATAPPRVWRGARSCPPASAPAEAHTMCACYSA